VKFWLYRVLQMDDDGDPLDHGVVKAREMRDVKRYLTRHLDHTIGIFDGMVRIYPLQDAERGVLKSVKYKDIRINTRSA